MKYYHYDRFLLIHVLIANFRLMGTTRLVNHKTRFTKIKTFNKCLLQAHKLMKNCHQWSMLMVYTLSLVASYGSRAIICVFEIPKARLYRRGWKDLMKVLQLMKIWVCESGDYIGLPYPPPAKAPSSTGTAILRGLNYASGAGGILDGTGANYVSFNFIKHRRLS